LYGPSCNRPVSGRGCLFAFEGFCFALFLICSCFDTKYLLSLGTICDFASNNLGEECNDLGNYTCSNAVVGRGRRRICDRFCGNDHLESCNPFYYPDGVCDDEEMDCGPCADLIALPGSQLCGQCYFRGIISADGSNMNLAAQQQYLESDADYSGTGCVRPPGFVRLFIIINNYFNLMMIDYLFLFLLFRVMDSVVIRAVQSHPSNLEKPARSFVGKAV
jgi:hypothetical protein